MPVLPLADNPPSRFPKQSIIDCKETWWIAKVKPRQEKALAKDLLKNSIAYYLPYFVKKNKRADSTSLRKSLLPLFPSYLPFAMSGDPWVMLQSKRVSSILHIPAQDTFKKQLNQVYLANEKGVEVIPINLERYSIGRKVRVIAGPLKGMAGKIVKYHQKNMLVLSVQILGDSCVVIDSKYIEL